MDSSSSRDLSAISARLEGRVQGVGFRYYCQLEGRRLGLSGWVRNLPNGDVEVWAEGSTENLNDFLQWLRDGPPSARVDCLHYDTVVPTGQYKKFAITR